MNLLNFTKKWMGVILNKERAHGFKLKPRLKAQPSSCGRSLTIKGKEVNLIVVFVVNCYTVTLGIVIP